MVLPKYLPQTDERDFVEKPSADERDASLPAEGGGPLAVEGVARILLMKPQDIQTLSCTLHSLSRTFVRQLPLGRSLANKTVGFQPWSIGFVQSRKVALCFHSTTFWFFIRLCQNTPPKALRDEWIWSRNRRFSTERRTKVRRRKKTAIVKNTIINKRKAKAF